MADPISMTVMAVGAATSAYGSIRQGQAANAAGKYNQRAAYAEAAAQDIQAGQEIAVASHNSTRIAARMRELLAEQQANAAAGGGSTQDASVVAIRDETVKTSTLDQLLEMTAAEERAQAIRRGAQVTRTEGDMARAQGREAQRAGYIQAGSTLLSAAGTWGDKFGWPGSRSATTSASNVAGATTSGARRTSGLSSLRR
jgi:hypothetical protein